MIKDKRVKVEKIEIEDSALWCKNKNSLLLSFKAASTSTEV